MKIYVADSRKDIVLREKDIMPQDLYMQLYQSRELPYTLAEFLRLPADHQNELKDTGGFIAGTLNGGRRRSSTVMSRSAITLDADSIPCDMFETLLNRVTGLGVQYCIYSTAKHSPAAPRVRVVIPFTRDVPADEYPFFARTVCQRLQPEMSWFDPVSAKPEQLMYYPSHCKDIAPVYYCSPFGMPLLDVDAWAALFPNWKDQSTWSLFPKEQDIPKRLAAKQKDPTEKDGAVGAFCRVYDVPGAMAKYLPGVYEETAAEERYTFTGGSTAGGAILYDDGKFLYSHHATDPAGGRLVNAFDLVRLHKFGNLDDEAKQGTPAVKLPSYAAMMELAKEDPDVRLEMARESFKDCGTIADEDAAQQLAKYDGKPLDKECMRLVLRAMGITARQNVITNKCEISGVPPACPPESAANNTPVYIRDQLVKLGVTGAGFPAVEKYLGAVIAENLYNPVAEMLQSAPWDGVHRVSVLLEILGITPGSFSDTLLQKWLVQCVAMAFNNGRHSTAAAGVLVLQGPQQTGKTSFFRRLAACREWFTEGASVNMNDKDTLINATGAWITELGELDSTLRRDQASLKAFITNTTDSYRRPYAREAEDKPRRTSFCGTVNGEQFLRDTTGDARFWVIQTNHIDLAKLWSLPDSFFVDLWHEVYAAWVNAPDSFRLTPEQRAQLEQQNATFRESLPGEEEIRNALDFDLPEDKWREYTTSELRLLVSGADRITTNMIGVAVRKIARESPGITVRKTKQGALYRLPIASARFSQG